MMRLTRRTASLLAGMCLLGSASTASAQEQVIGLLPLPAVFGKTPCERFTPSEVRLYAAPDVGSPIGAIRVDAPRTFHPAGGCEGLLVNVHRTGAGVQPLPTREFAYEQPAAVVLDRRDRWTKIRLADGAAWVQQPSRTEFFSLQRLLTGGLTYLTEEWDGRLAGALGAPLRGALRSDLGEQPVRVMTFRVHGGRLWAQVEVLARSACESDGTPRVTVRGWLPAHAVSGESNLWFYSRGC